jgi:predicted nucleic acid-binding Zn ribbon protein
VSTYQYRCAGHGTTDVRLPIGTATATRPCETCGAEMARVYSAPMLGLAPRGIMAAIDRTRATADTPAVVSSLPTGGRRAPAAPRPAPALLNPALRRLPRP